MKTLKDLIEESPERLNRISGNDLRQEAIKWIKEIRTLNPPTFPEFACCDDGNGWHDTLENWIKHFFNITDEDLK